MGFEGYCVRPRIRSLAKRPRESGFSGGFLCYNMETACMTVKPTKRKTSQRDERENPDVCVFKAKSIPWISWYKTTYSGWFILFAIKRVSYAHMIRASKSTNNLCDPKVWPAFLTHMLQMVICNKLKNKLQDSRSTEINMSVHAYVSCIFNSEKKNRNTNPLVRLTYRNIFKK